MEKNELQPIEDNIKDRNQNNYKDKRTSRMIFIVCGILFFPVWFPLVISILLVIFCLLLVYFCVVFAFGVASVALAGAGLFTLVVGIITLFIHAPTGIAALGASCIVLGTGALLFVITLWLAYWFKLSLSFCAYLLYRKRRARE